MSRFSDSESDSDLDEDELLCARCHNTETVAISMEYFRYTPCGHLICTSCERYLFRRRNRQPCPQCGKTLTSGELSRKTPAMQAYEREAAVRRKMRAIYNKTEEDFPSTTAFHDYLETTETLIHRLTSPDEAVRTAAQNEVKKYQTDFRSDIDRNSSRAAAERLASQRAVREEKAERERRLQRLVRTLDETRERRKQAEVVSNNALLGIQGPTPQTDRVPPQGTLNPADNNNNNNTNNNNNNDGSGMMDIEGTSVPRGGISQGLADFASAAEHMKRHVERMEARERKNNEEGEEGGGGGGGRKEGKRRKGLRSRREVKVWHALRRAQKAAGETGWTAIVEPPRRKAQRGGGYGALLAVRRGRSELLGSLFVF